MYKNTLHSYLCFKRRAEQTKQFEYLNVVVNDTLAKQ